MRNKIVASVSLAAVLLAAACSPTASEPVAPASEAPAAPVAEVPAAPAAEPAPAAAATDPAAAPVAGTETAAAPADAAPAATETPAAASPYATADLAAGKQSYMIKCRACHAVEAAAGDMVGPNLHGVFQRKPGAKPGFRYSDAMVAFAKTTTMTAWQPEEIDEWLAKPTEYLPGSAMFFNGIKDPGERKNLIGFLMSETAK